jgi:thioredoxin 1
MFNFLKRKERIKALEIGKENFEEIIKSKKLVYVYFEAPWCGACKMLHPILNELADENKEKDVLVTIVDVDTEKELAQRFRIMSIPQLVVFKNGKQEFQGSGMISKPRTQEMIDNYLK